MTTPDHIEDPTLIPMQDLRDTVAHWGKLGLVDDFAVKLVDAIYDEFETAQLAAKQTKDRIATKEIL